MRTQNVENLDRLSLNLLSSRVQVSASELGVLSHAMVNLHCQLDGLRKVHDIDEAHLLGVPGRHFLKG